MSKSLLLVALFALIPGGCTRDTGGDVGGTPAGPPEVHQPAGAPDAVYRVPVDDLPRIGSDRALVTIVEFTDYQCPFCRRAEATLERLRAEYKDDLRVAVAERPLPMHDRARPAALAALAADEQHAFEAMHQRLFAVGGLLDEASLLAAARDAGLDLPRFASSRQSASVARSLDAAESLAGRLGVRGTPTFFINGRRVSGAQPFDVFKQVIDERLASARVLLRSGIRRGSIYEAAVEGGLEHVQEDPDTQGPNPAVPDKVESVPIAGAPSRGPLDAPITVVAFSDFQCPYCAKAQASIHALEQAHPGAVRVVFKNRPLPMHDAAGLAAKAALAADAQGRFWDYHDALFAHQSALDRASLERYARELGMDVARFSRDLDDARLDARLASDNADAQALGVSGTPTFFVNGRRVVGAQPYATFEAAALAR